jgi:hypothetical protein
MKGSLGSGNDSRLLFHLIPEEIGCYLTGRVSSLVILA